MSDLVTLTVNGAPFRCPPARLPLVQSIFAGRYGVTPPTDADARVRRVLDIGAGCGEFALWAAARWPGCWVDCWEPDPELRALIRDNGPAGARVVEGYPITNWEVYDVVRIAIPCTEPSRAWIGRGTLYIRDTQEIR